MVPSKTPGDDWLGQTKPETANKSKMLNRVV